MPGADREVGGTRDGDLAVVLAPVMLRGSVWARAATPVCVAGPPRAHVVLPWFLTVTR